MSFLVVLKLKATNSFYSEIDKKGYNHVSFSFFTNLQL